MSTLSGYLSTRHLEVLPNQKYQDRSVRLGSILFIGGLKETDDVLNGLFEVIGPLNGLFDNARLELHREQFFSQGLPIHFLLCFYCQLLLCLRLLRVF